MFHIVALLSLALCFNALIWVQLWLEIYIESCDFGLLSSCSSISPLTRFTSVVFRSCYASCSSPYLYINSPFNEFQY